jgi:hypothetical protein
LTLLQGLDQQPGVYTLEEFIRGAATAIKGIFPSVAHASFCLLNNARNFVNMCGLAARCTTCTAERALPLPRAPLQPGLPCLPVAAASCPLSPASPAAASPSASALWLKTNSTNPHRIRCSRGASHAHGRPSYRYTFLGDGSLKPPRINVAVAPGTLIYHVLHNCQPVFISNVAAFPGPYADVQVGAPRRGPVQGAGREGPVGTVRERGPAQQRAVSRSRRAARLCAAVKACARGAGDCELSAGVTDRPRPAAPDPQFMRFVLNLRSVACLPLVVADSRVLGVLRLGFDDLWNWSEQEKVGSRGACAACTWGPSGPFCYSRRDGNAGRGPWLACVTGAAVLWDVAVERGPVRRARRASPSS